MKTKNQDLINFFDSLDGEIMQDEQMLLTSTFGGDGPTNTCEINNCNGGNCAKGCQGKGSPDDTPAAPEE